MIGAELAVSAAMETVPRVPGEAHRDRYVLDAGRWFAIVAITAGIMEEIIYRALPFAVLALWWPGGDARIYAIIGVLFGLAHVYQGAAGVASTALLGTLLGLVYAGTGSLLPAMALHALVDLRLLLARPRR